MAVCHATRRCKFKLEEVALAPTGGETGRAARKCWGVWRESQKLLRDVAQLTPSGIGFCALRAS